ncbi:MAG: hypothetical protein HQL53_04445 [Magnetococcales bacterium]|nr:hypothetical protein [Magnetococcales bacterium]
MTRYLSPPFKIEAATIILMGPPHWLGRFALGGGGGGGGGGFRFGRVVILDPQGGLQDSHGRGISYLNPNRLPTLLHSPNDLMGGVQERRALISVVQQLLGSGVGSVSLCRLEDLASELFTYGGCGTFFSERHYCRIRRLRFDDFPQVAAIIRRGEEEKYLLPRNEPEVMALLIGGYGAFIDGQHLAGVCSLLTEPYRKDRAGEIVSLYALTRFKGEGIGGQLIQRIGQDVAGSKLRYLFACTRRKRVVGFFARHGFHETHTQNITDAKWRHYDAKRKDALHVMKLDLEV